MSASNCLYIILISQSDNNLRGEAARNNRRIQAIRFMNATLFRVQDARRV